MSRMKASIWPEAHEQTVDEVKRKRVATAKKIRDKHIAACGESCGPFVQMEMEQEHPHLCDGADWRFLGTLFNSQHWKVLRYEKLGSHGRPVPIWGRK